MNVLLPPPPSQLGLDPRNCRFTFQYTTFLGNIRIGGYSKLFKFGCLPGPEVLEQSMDWVKDALSDPDVDIHLVSSIATITATRSKPTITDVKNRMHWG